MSLHPCYLRSFPPPFPPSFPSFFLSLESLLYNRFTSFCVTSDCLFLLLSTLWDFLWTRGPRTSFVILNFQERALEHVFYFYAFHFYGMFYILIFSILLSGRNNFWLLFLQRRLSTSLVLERSFPCNKTDGMSIMR